MEKLKDKIKEVLLERGWHLDEAHILTDYLHEKDLITFDLIYREGLDYEYYDAILCNVVIGKTDNKDVKKDVIWESEVMFPNNYTLEEFIEVITRIQKSINKVKLK